MSGIGTGFTNPTHIAGTSGVYFKRSPPVVTPEDIIIDAEDDSQNFPRDFGILDPRPAVVENRGKNLHLDEKVLGYTTAISFNAKWRYWVMQGPPMVVFFPCEQEKIRELNKLNVTGADQKTFDTFIDQAMDAIKNKDKSFFADPANADFSAALDEALNAQCGRKTADFLRSWGVRSERGYATSKDQHGILLELETLDILKSAKFYNGVELHLDGDSFRSELTVPGRDKPIVLFEGSVNGPQTFFQIGKNIPSEYRNKAIVAWATMISEHQQSVNSQEVTITPGNVLDVISLSQILLGKSNMKLDLSEVDDMVTKALNNSTSDRGAALKTLWADIKAVNAKSPRDPLELNRLLNDTAAYSKSSAPKHMTGPGGP